MLKRLFTAHPASVGESYVEHFGVALSFGVSMIAAGLACLVHAIFPFLFVTTGSRAIRGLYERMVTKRRRHPAAVLVGEAPTYLGDAI